MAENQVLFFPFGQWISKVDGRTYPKTCRYCDCSIKKETAIVGKWIGECRCLPPFTIAIPSERGVNLVIQWPTIGESPLMYCHHWINEDEAEHSQSIIRRPNVRKSSAVFSFWTVDQQG